MWHSGYRQDLLDRQRRKHRFIFPSSESCQCAGVNGAAYGKLLAFGYDGKLLGAFSDDARFGVIGLDPDYFVAGGRSLWSIRDCSALRNESSVSIVRN